MKIADCETSSVLLFQHAANRTKAGLVRALLSPPFEDLILLSDVHLSESSHCFLPTSRTEGYQHMGFFFLNLWVKKWIEKKKHHQISLSHFNTRKKIYVNQFTSCMTAWH